MPYLKPKAEPWKKLVRLLRGYGITGAALAGILEVSQPTAYRRLREPGSFTLDELYAVSVRGHVPMEEIREAVSR